jgi:hypothetical protein
MDFYYIPLKDLMDDFNSFTWQTGLEPLLEQSASHSRHAVLRVYCDYPNKETGVPDFLWDLGLETMTNEETGQTCPDFHNEDLQEALL